MNLFTKQKETHRLREPTFGYRGEGWREGAGSLGLTCPHCYIQNGKPTRTYCVAQGTLLNVTWQPGREGSLGENGYMCMYG